MNEVSSRTLSGHLRASASAGRTGGPGNFNPPVARDCTVKKTHYSKLKLGAAPFVMSVALVSAPAYAQDAAVEGAAPGEEIVATGTLIRNLNLEQSTPVNVKTDDKNEMKQTNADEEVQHGRAT